MMYNKKYERVHYATGISSASVVREQVSMRREVPRHQPGSTLAKRKVRQLREGSEVVKFIPSATVHKKYKFTETYKPKIIIADGSNIKSITLENVHNHREDAVKEAKVEIERLVREEYIGEEIEV